MEDPFNALSKKITANENDPNRANAMVTDTWKIGTMLYMMQIGGQDNLPDTYTKAEKRKIAAEGMVYATFCAISHLNHKEFFEICKEIIKTIHHYRQKRNEEIESKSTKTR